MNWYGDFVWEAARNGSALLLFGIPTEEELAAERERSFVNMPSATDKTVEERLLSRKLTEYYRAISPDEAAERYGERIDYSFYPHELSNKYGSVVPNSRDYGWFGIVCEGMRGRSLKTISASRGLPEDCTPHVRKWVEDWGADGHSHSWLGCDEILKRTDLSEYPQWQFIKQHVADPENTRMVFFFDN